MRIDFGASYKDISGLLKAPAHHAVKDESVSFEQDLKGVLTKTTKTSETIGDLQKPPQFAAIRDMVRNPLEEFKASLRFPDPSLEMPRMTPLGSSENQPIQVADTAQNVKVPTVLEVKRIDIQHAPVIAERQVPQLATQEIRARLHSLSEKVGLDPALSMAVVKAESSFNTTAVSSDGHASKGLFQLLDTTGKFLLSKAGDTERSYDPFNPDLNMELGTSYLRYLHDIFRAPTDLPNKLRTHKAVDETSLEKLAVAAFNAGEGRVASAQNRSERAGRDPTHYDHVAPFLPRSTREYVTRVIAGKELF